MKERKIRLFLNNGFKYEGVQLKDSDGFLVIRDSKDNRVREFPHSSISLVEVVE